MSKVSILLVMQPVKKGKGLLSVFIVVTECRFAGLFNNNLNRIQNTILNLYLLCTPLCNYRVMGRNEYGTSQFLI